MMDTTCIAKFSKNGKKGFLVVDGIDFIIAKKKQET